MRAALVRSSESRSASSSALAVALRCVATYCPGTCPCGACHRAPLNARLAWSHRSKAPTVAAGIPSPTKPLSLSPAFIADDDLLLVSGVGAVARARGVGAAALDSVTVELRSQLLATTLPRITSSTRA